NELGLPSLPLICLCHQMPMPCADDDKTSGTPSPSTSKAYMSAQGSPMRAGWNFHGVLPSGFSGCSHQPPVQITSSRPSPLTSPPPRPWSNWFVPGTYLPGIAECLCRLARIEVYSFFSSSLPAAASSAPAESNALSSSEASFLT